jgi:hypothetical protein
MLSIYFINDFQKKKTALSHAGQFPEQSGGVLKGIFAV